MIETNTNDGHLTYIQDFPVVDNPPPTAQVQNFEGFVPVELGGVNVMQALIVSAATGKVAFDCDGQERSVPGLQVMWFENVIFLPLFLSFFPLVTFLSESLANLIFVVSYSLLYHQIVLPSHVYQPPICTLDSMVWWGGG